MWGAESVKRLHVQHLNVQKSMPKTRFCIQRAQPRQTENWPKDGWRQQRDVRGKRMLRPKSGSKGQQNKLHWPHRALKMPTSMLQWFKLIRRHASRRQMLTHRRG